MTRYAMIVSCEDYTNFKGIDFCHADAGLIRETLVEYCDYEYANIDFFSLYKGDDNTPDNIYQMLQETIKKAKKDDSVLFYFAGHGIKVNKKGYLLLPDSVSSDFENTALDLKHINDLLSDSCINGFLILDACHSGINARNAFESSVVDVIPDTGCITLASCSENEESYPDSEIEQGVFTYYLCEEIKKIPVGDAILIEQLKIYVCNRVAEWAKKNYKKQTPTLNGVIVGNTAFAIRNSKVYDQTTGTITMYTFKEQLQKLEEDFQNKCYCINLELELHSEYAIFENPSLGQDICKQLELSGYKLVKGWPDILVNLLFYMSRVKEDREIGISLDEQNEIISQIRLFVDSIPSGLDNSISDIKKTNIMQKEEVKRPTKRQMIYKNVSNFVMNAAHNISNLIDSIPEDSMKSNADITIKDYRIGENEKNQEDIKGSFLPFPIMKNLYPRENDVLITCGEDEVIINGGHCEIKNVGKGPLLKIEFDDIFAVHEGIKYIPLPPYSFRYNTTLEQGESMLIDLPQISIACDLTTAPHEFSYLIHMKYEDVFSREFHMYLKLEYYENADGEGYDTYYQIEKGEYEELRSLENQFVD